MTDTDLDRRSGRVLRADAAWLLRVVATTVGLIVLVSFLLSFNSQRDLAAEAHIPALFAWGWPLIVDGTIIVATFAVLIMGPRSRRVSWYPWTILVLFGVVSIYANGVHATGRRPSLIEAFVIGAIPALALLVSTHLLVLMLTAPEEVPSDRVKAKQGGRQVKRADRRGPALPLATVAQPLTVTAVASRPAAPSAGAPQAPAPKIPASRPVTSSPRSAAGKDAAKVWARQVYAETGAWPSSARMAARAGLSSIKSGRRLVLELEAETAGE